MRSGVAALVLVLSGVPVFADTLPFDMSREKPALPAPPVATQDEGPAVDTQQPAPVQPAVPAPNAAETQPIPEAQDASAGFVRYVVPFKELVLAGETSRRAWSVYLTPEQAASPTKLHLAYANSILVAPETSKLTVRVNGIAIFEPPMNASGGKVKQEAEIPASLLKAGQNVVSIESSLRHRTDCTVESTYELWAEIDPAGTYFAFDAADAGQLRRIEDIAAVGVDERGATHFNLVVPSLDQAATTSAIMRLSEGLAMTANMPNQSITVSRAPVDGRAPGSLKVFLGTAEELAAVLPALPAGAMSAPMADFIEDPAAGGPALVVTGPSWPSLQQAIGLVADPVDRPADVRRLSLQTHSWRTPDAPLLVEDSQRSFAELGVATQEFGGRVFRTDFAFGVPSDFYAKDYGEATILLDAAYSDDVLPGSHIDIYVNSNIASTVPITQSGGAILRRFPVGVTMRHFRPGVNVIVVEAVLHTEADRVCAPDATAPNEPRFVLFDTSQFAVPTFARIARLPDLSEMSGTGFPYNISQHPVALVVERGQPGALSAAATLMGRMSVAAGRTIPVEPMSAGAAADRNAIFVGTIDAISPQVVAQVGISQESARIWSDGTITSAIALEEANTDETFDRWREKLSGRGWHGTVSVLQDWLTRNFDLSFGSLRLLPGGNAEYMPARGTSLVVAQQAGPSGATTWTVITAPTDNALLEGVRTLTAQEGWREVAGRVSALDGSSGEISTVPVERFSFVETRPFSIGNYRLIAANWLSGNPLLYALVLFVACSLLGLVTARLLSKLGRRR